MTRTANRRKTRLVDRKFQVGLAWRMFFAFFLLFFCGLLLIFAPSMVRLATGSDLASLEPAAQEFLVLHKRIWPAAIFIAAGMFFYTLLLSHRIAGPIYRINDVLRKMAEGDYPRTVALRRHDFFRTTAELLEAACRRREAERTAAAPRGERPGEAPQ